MPLEASRFAWHLQHGGVNHAVADVVRAEAWEKASSRLLCALPASSRCWMLGPCLGLKSQ
eukprot:8665074-Alexandrium_andersonii.AAC.1